MEAKETKATDAKQCKTSQPIVWIKSRKNDIPKWLPYCPVVYKSPLGKKFDRNMSFQYPEIPQSK